MHNNRPKTVYSITYKIKQQLINNLVTNKTNIGTPINTYLHLFCITKRLTFPIFIVTICSNSLSVLSNLLVRCWRFRGRFL